MSDNVDKIYSNFAIDRKQALTLAFLVLQYDVDAYIAEHPDEYQKFLLDEETKQKGGHITR